MSQSFSVSFSILGTFMLFVSSKPTTVGSVLMVAAISLALSNAFGDASLDRGQLVRLCGNADVPLDTPLMMIGQLCAYRALSAAGIVDRDAHN